MFWGHFFSGSRQAAAEWGWLCPGYLPVKRKFFLKAVTRRKLSDCLGFVTNIVRSLRHLLLLTSACTVKAMNVCCFEKHQHFSGVSGHLINRNFCSAWVTETPSNTAAEMNASSVSVHVKVSIGWGWLLYSVSFVLIYVMWEKYVRSNVKLKLHSQQCWWGREWYVATAPKPQLLALALPKAVALMEMNALVCVLFMGRCQDRLTVKWSKVDVQ